LTNFSLLSICKALGIADELDEYFQAGDDKKQSSNLRKYISDCGLSFRITGKVTTGSKDAVDLLLEHLGKVIQPLNSGSTEPAM
jgi:hypothetical protein